MEANSLGLDNGYQWLTIPTYSGYARGFEYYIIRVEQLVLSRNKEKARDEVSADKCGDMNGVVTSYSQQLSVYRVCLLRRQRQSFVEHNTNV